MAPGCAPGWEGRAVRVLRNFFCMTLGFLRLLKNLPRKSMLAQFLLECLKEGKKKQEKTTRCHFLSDGLFCPGKNVFVGVVSVA